MNHIISDIRTQLQNITSARPKSSGLAKGEGTSAISSPAVRPSSSAQNILITAAWFGLVTGLIEGTGLWALQQLGWLAGPFTFLGASLEIIWISALFDLLMFSILGLALSLIARLLPRLPVMLLAVFLFASLTFFDWLAIPLIGHISIFAVFILAVGLAVQFSRSFLNRQERLVRFWQRSTPWLGALALLTLVGIQGGFWLREQVAVTRLPEAAPGSPNILVIIVDTLRADHVSSYGYSRPTSPNLDRIAQGGVLFANAFSTSSWTKPSHASLVTGRYVYEHGADAYKSLDDRYPTIAEALRARGYRTGAFSANVGAFNRRLGFGRGFIHFEDYYRSIGDVAISTVYGRVIETYILHHGLGFEGELGRKWATDIDRSVLRWIDRDRGRPFFAFLNYYDPHAPYVPPQPYRSKFSQLKNPGGLINTYWDMQHIYVPMTPEQLQGEIDAYDGTIAYVDNYIGQLLAELQKRGLAEDTLVVITADHGELFGEHGLLEHTNSLYREVLHVPLIFWWPGHIPEGKRIEVPVSNVALPPTLLDLIGAEGQTSFPGPSLAQLWSDTGAHQDWPYPLAEIAQIPWVPAQHLPAHGAMRSVLSPQWQYIVHEKFGEELYDWRADPKESANVAQNQEFQPIMEQFRTHLEMLLASVPGLSK
jgi:arylsulfatase A-like enzyme